MAKLAFNLMLEEPRETYIVTSAALIVGRIDCIQAEPVADQQWAWAMHLDIGVAPFRRGGNGRSADEAASKMREAWEDWKVWAGLQDVDGAEGTVTAAVQMPLKSLT
ncbi:hypothetical protein ACYQR9_03720 [Methylobacterium sp. CM6241]